MSPEIPNPPINSKTTVIDKLYIIGKYLPAIVYLLVFVTGLFLLLFGSSGSGSKFMENPITMRIMAVCFFLGGIHQLSFNRRWARDNVLRMTKFLENKPVFIQKWLDIHKSYSYSWFLNIFIGGAFIIAAIILFSLSK